MRRRLDPLTPEQRSRCMSRIRSTGTTPEIIVRRLVHGLGYRYRLHARELPGRPDLVFRRRRKVIFIHGCFWHRHACKRGELTPATNTKYWKPKFIRNIQRDLANQTALRMNDWDVLVIWECELQSSDRLAQKIEKFLRRKRMGLEIGR